MNTSIFSAVALVATLAAPSFAFAEGSTSSTHHSVAATKTQTKVTAAKPSTARGAKSAATHVAKASPALKAPPAKAKGK